MDIRKQLIILILVLLCAPVSAQKKRETDHTEVHKYPIIRGYAKSGKAKRIHFLL